MRTIRQVASASVYPHTKGDQVGLVFEYPHVKLGAATIDWLCLSKWDGILYMLEMGLMSNPQL